MTRPLRITIETLILSGFFMLPFARLKLTVMGIPIYALEIPIFLAGFTLLAAAIKKRALPSIPLFSDTFLLTGIALFFFSTILSFIVHPFSSTGLGLIKSWFIFPIVGAALWSVARWDATRLLTAWFVSISGIALSALAYLSSGALTFDGRLEAWYSSPNFLAIALAPGILIGTHLLISLLAEEKKRLSLIAAASLSLPVIAIALFFTRSYGAWIAIAIALGAYLLSVSMTKKQTVAVFVIILSAIAVFAFSEYGSEKWQSLASLDERSSLSSRIMIWRSAATMIADHPVSGIGIGRFQEEYLAYQQYFPPYLEWAVPEPHNLFLALWLNTGLIGLAGFVLIIVRFAWRLFRIGHLGEKEKMSRSLILCLMLLFLGYGFLDTPYFGNDLSFVFWMLIASGIGLAANPTDRSDTADGSAGQ